MEQGRQRRSLVEGGVALNVFIEAIRASTINRDATADDIVERVRAELGVPIRRVAAIQLVVVVVVGVGVVETSLCAVHNT